MARRTRPAGLHNQDTPGAVLKTSDRFAVLAAGLLSCFAPAAAGAQGAPGTVLKVNAAEIAIGGRVQTQLNTTSVEGEPSSELVLRRVRLEATVKVNDVVSGKVQPDFAGNRVSLKDAWLKLNLHPAFQLLAGNAHRPFSPITTTSSTRMLPIERGVRIRGVSGEFDQYQLVSALDYSERDLGLQVIGEPKGAPLGLTYQAGYFNGPARAAAADESTWQGAARVTVQPVRNVRVGAAWSGRDFARKVPLPDSVDTRRGNAYEVDVEYGARSRGLHLVGEAAYGDFDPFRGARFIGAQGWLGWRSGTISGTISAVEPLVRVSHGDPNVNDRAGVTATGGTLFTPGLNLWLGGLNRVQLNLDLWDPRTGGTRATSFKTQFQLAF